jgi:hypothetical protein
MYRETNGRFAKRKAKVGVALVLIAVGGYFVWGAPVVEWWLGRKIEATNEIINEVVIDKSDEKFAAKIDVLKDEVVAELAKCESGGRKEEDGIVILDSNDKGSYGVMQWQRKSVQHYYKLRTGTEINGRDAIILALQGDRAKDLAKWVIFETKSGVAKDWVNCSKWHGLQSKVDMIKKIEAK